MFTLEDILIANKNHLIIQSTSPINPNLSFVSAQHDSRQCGTQDLFVAIKGAVVDGHRFIPELARAGTTAVLCTTPHPDAPPELLQLVVPDVIKALQATARVRVERQPETRKIGITGSSGKTTTKEAIATILGEVSPTLKTYASYNNELGYPLTLLRLEADQQYAVLEMGAEWVGELRALCETCVRPDWSLITTVGSAHLKHFGSLENVAIAKSELVQVLSKNGIALLNYDDPAVRAMQAKTQARVIFYGKDEQATVRGEDIQDAGLFGSRFLLRIGSEKLPIQLHLPGEHSITIALAAAAVGYAAGIPIETIGHALEGMQPVHARGVIYKDSGPNGSTLIDDTYNAIRQSVVVMVQAMRNTPLPAGSKRWAVLGELLEQGDHTPAEHYAAGLALPRNVDYVVTLGDYARLYGEGAQHAGMPAEHIYHFPVDPQKTSEVEASKQEIATFLKARVAADDLVLIKGSRGMRMETMFPLFQTTTDGE